VNFSMQIRLVGRVSSFELGEGEHFNVCKGELMGIKGKKYIITVKWGNGMGGSGCTLYCKSVSDYDVT